MLDGRHHIKFGACDVCDGLGEVASHEGEIGLSLCGACIVPLVTSPRPPTVPIRSGTSLMEHYLRTIWGDGRDKWYDEGEEWKKHK